MLVWTTCWASLADSAVVPHSKKDKDFSEHKGELILQADASKQPDNTNKTEKPQAWHWQKWVFFKEVGGRGTSLTRYVELYRKIKWRARLCVTLHINPPGYVGKALSIIWSPFSVHYARPPGKPWQIRATSTSLTSSLKLKWPSLHPTAPNMRSHTDQRQHKCHTNTQLLADSSITHAVGRCIDSCLWFHMRPKMHLSPINAAGGGGVANRKSWKWPIISFHLYTPAFAAVRKRSIEKNKGGLC